MKPDELPYSDQTRTVSNVVANGSQTPWLDGVRGTQVLPLIESDARVIRVEAGPGTGKTFGLVRRVQRLLHPAGAAVDGREVLIVAFNRVIAQALAADVMAGLGASDYSGEPVIRTVHALCLSAIGGDLRILLPHEREAMIYDVLEMHPELIPPGAARPADATEQALLDHEARHVQNVPLWQGVREWLIRHKAQLMGELPGLLLDRLEAGDVTTRRYRHVIVDEFQDLTEGEQRLFGTLMSPGGSLVALGDPRQSIYLFRGNDKDGLAKLPTLVAEPVVDVPMTECQRCPETIVHAANQLMGLYSAPAMVPTSTRPANVHVVYWDTPMDEATGMAEAIVQNVRAHPDESHLVMTTRRRFAYLLREAIARFDPDITVDLSFSESLLETWAVREAFILFCLLVDPDPPTWRAWLGYQNSTDGKHYKASKRNADAYLQFLARCGDTITWEQIEALAEEERGQRRGSGGAILWDRARRCVELRDAIGPLGSDPAPWLESVFDTDRWVTKDTDEPDVAVTDLVLALEKAKEILRAADLADEAGSAAPTNGGEAPRESSDESVENVVRHQLQRVARVLRYQIATREPFVAEADANVQVATLWGAKGVTADHVYVVGLCGEALPGERRPEYPGTDLEYFEEQRRLFYVSLTRAKSTLVLSRATRVQRSMAQRMGLGVSATGGWYPALHMCPFLQDLVGYLPTAIYGPDWGGV